MDCYSTGCSVVGRPSSDETRFGFDLEIPHCRTVSFGMRSYGAVKRYSLVVIDLLVLLGKQC